MGVEPRWKPVYPVGYPGAIDSMGSVAAPLLASVTAGVIVFVATDKTPFRWPNLTMVLLFIGLFALIATVQFAFRARSYVVSPTQIEEWWPDQDEATDHYRRRVQRAHWDGFFQWANRARWAYNVGLLLLAAALATITAPKTQTHQHITSGRWLVVAVACLGFAAEALWIVLAYFRRNPDVILPDVRPERAPEPAIAGSSAGDG